MKKIATDKLSSLFCPLRAKKRITQHGSKISDLNEKLPKTNSLATVSKNTHIHSNATKYPALLKKFANNKHPSLFCPIIDNNNYISC